MRDRQDCLCGPFAWDLLMERMKGNIGVSQHGEALREPREGDYRSPQYGLYKGYVKMSRI